MKKIYLVGLSFILCLALTLTVSAYDGITYNFDEVEVLFAAEFTAVPQSAQADQWFTDIAGGTDKPVEILYGIVKLKENNGEGNIIEEFIKITGENGSERFLSNSMSNEWSNGGNGSKLESNKTLFWSGKQLEDTSVVKDYSKPLKSVILKKSFDSDENLISIDIYFINEGDKDRINNFWNLINTISSDFNISSNHYSVDMSAVKYTGDATITR
jgi:hypothetical protein